MTYGDFLRWISRGLLDRLPRVCHFGTLLAGSIPRGIRDATRMAAFQAASSEAMIWAIWTRTRANVVGVQFLAAFLEGG
jgi:hypothetical protein